MKRSVVGVNRRQFLKTAGLGSIAAASLPAIGWTARLSHAAGDVVGLMRWDIIHVNFATLTLSAGGIASARAVDNSKITLTGSGTFRALPGNPQAVSGGGDWTTYAPDGTTVTGSGTYAVTGFVSAVLAPGTAPLPNDEIGPLANERAGLLVFKIGYSDGSQGTLTLSCHLNGSPDSIFEGVTATKDFVDYWNREAPPAPPGDADRTNFHVL